MSAVVWNEGIKLIRGLQGAMKWKYWKADVWLNPGLGGIIYFHISVWEKCTASVLFPLLLSQGGGEGARVAFDLFSYLLVLETRLYNSHIRDLCPQNLKYASDVASLAKLTGCQWHGINIKMDKLIRFFKLKSLSSDSVHACAAFQLLGNENKVD